MRFLPSLLLAFLAAVSLRAEEEQKFPAVVDAKTIHGKVLCGYQGWFRTPDDAGNSGWIHYSRETRKITPESLVFEMWPDMTEYSPAERHAAPGFTDASGRQMELYSADNADTVRRHFEWMRRYGIDGVWLQHFVVDLPGGPFDNRYPSRSRVLSHVRDSARQTGRVWAVAYDIGGMPNAKIFEVLTREWKKLVDDGVTADDRYLHEGGIPVVQVWGFYYKNHGNDMSAALANQLVDFFKAPGPYHAYFVGGGDWDWRRNPDPEWQAFYKRFDAYAPWNIGNTSKDKGGILHAATSYWADDKRECEKNGVFWLPTIYSGFSWDNLQKKPPGTTLVSRRGGQFLWEQFHTLSQMGVDSVCVAMFDEMDEGTAIFKITNSPPTQGHFVTYEGKPSDWYLRLMGEGTRLLREKIPVPAGIPLKP